MVEVYASLDMRLCYERVTCVVAGIDHAAAHSSDGDVATFLPTSAQATSRNKKTKASVNRLPTRIHTINHQICLCDGVCVCVTCVHECATCTGGSIIGRSHLPAPNPPACRSAKGGLGRGAKTGGRGSGGSGGLLNVHSRLKRISKYHWGCAAGTWGCSPFTVQSVASFRYRRVSSPLRKWRAIIVVVVLM